MFDPDDIEDLEDPDGLAKDGDTEETTGDDVTVPSECDDYYDYFGVYP
jgi:hypothetical protein